METALRFILDVLRRVPSRSISVTGVADIAALYSDAKFNEVELSGYGWVAFILGERPQGG